MHGLITQECGGRRPRAEKKAHECQAQSAKAETWLVGFLAGEKAGHSKDAVHRARSNLGDRSVVPAATLYPGRRPAMIILPLDGQLATAGVDVGTASRPALVQPGINPDDLPDRPLR